jgi:hypothetical protein
MTDKPKTPPVPIPDPHLVPVIFVNALAGSGHCQGVANFTFVTARFTPNDDHTVDNDMIIASRLRMDLSCVQQLRDACNTILEQNLKPANGTTH